MQSTATLATVSGRYYAMDRDARWDRTRLAYDAIVHGIGELADDGEAAIASAYARGENDEFILPTVIGPYAGMGNEDVVVHLNFRADRARQLTQALALSEFDAFDRGCDPATCWWSRSPSTSRPLSCRWPCRLRAARHRLAGGASGTARQAAAPRCRDGEVRPRHVLLQRRCRGAVRRRGPRPRALQSGGGDLRPRTRDARRPHHRRDRGRHRAQGTTTSSSPTMRTPTWSGTRASGTRRLQAAEIIDACLGRVADPVAERGGTLVITADHGNIEEMRDAEGRPQTSHTTSPVPTRPRRRRAPGRSAPRGTLADVAPTLCELWASRPGRR